MIKVTGFETTSLTCRTSPRRSSTCIHIGGKAVIESVGRLVWFGSGMMEPVRMCLHEFGNTSNSPVFSWHTLRPRRGSGARVWMLVFGSGFKAISLVWRAFNDLFGSG